MKIILTGGATMGSVMPLLAVIEKLKEKNSNIKYLWLGTRHGPEKKMVLNYNIDFRAIHSGKFRRYFSWHNIFDLVKIKLGFWESLIILKKFKPDYVLSAGGFVAVPVVWAAWLLGIAVYIHQQDVRPGLANRLTASAAKKITVCFPETASRFNSRKTIVVGNPVRQLLKNHHPGDRQTLLGKYNLTNNLPLVLITGGGQGSLALNDLVAGSLGRLTEFCQIIHLTGGHRSGAFIRRNKTFSHYHKFEFLANNSEVLFLADMVISRAGMSTLTELAYLSKPAAIIPLPQSHQLDNAEYFYRHGAIECWQESDLDKNNFAQKIKALLNDKKKLADLSRNIHQIMPWGAEDVISNLIISSASQ